MQNSTGVVTPSGRESAVQAKGMRVQERMTFIVMQLVTRLALGLITGLVTLCVVALLKSSTCLDQPCAVQ